MRIFWSIIALLVLITAGVVISRRLQSAPSSPAPSSTEPTQLAAATPRPTQPPPQPHATPDPAPTPAPPPSQPEPQPPTSQPAAADQPPSQPADQPTPPPAPEPAAEEPTPTETAHAQEPAAEVFATTETTPAAPTTPEQPAAPTVNPDPSSPDLPEPSVTPTPPATVTTPGAPSHLRQRQTASPEALAAAEATKAPPALVRQADGTTLVADRFVIKGDGSKESPYEVTWEHLMSAQETYKPRIGMKVIPGWLNLIHDKWVKISGYVAFPVMAQGPDEMLMMLNQWDGCCIGVPPTPYDAIEVKLAKPAEGDTRLLVMGTVTGKLKVDPYLVKDWLVSLYIMDEAEVTRQTGVPLREAAMEQEHLAP